MALSEFSVKVPSHANGNITFIELKSGCRLLGAPVGSEEFALDCFDQQMATVQANALALKT